MLPRHVYGFLCAALFSASLPVLALDLASFSNSEANAGLKETLNRAATSAVSKLGAADGFLNNPQVRIPLPEGLQQAEKAMKLFGKQKQFDELEVSINLAAEAAMPEAKALLVSAIKSMSVQDAKGILSGGEDSVTQFFKGKTEGQLTQKFLPVIKKATDKVGLANKYNSLAAQASSFGLVKPEDSKIETYVTRKTLEGLFATLGQEERTIRQDPVGTGSALLKKIFGGN